MPKRKGKVAKDNDQIGQLAEQMNARVRAAVAKFRSDMRASYGLASPSATPKPLLCGCGRPIVLGTDCIVHALVTIFGDRLIPSPEDAIRMIQAAGYPVPEPVEEEDEVQIGIAEASPPAARARRHRRNTKELGAVKNEIMKYMTTRRGKEVKSGEVANKLNEEREGLLRPLKTLVAEGKLVATGEKATRTYRVA